MYYRCPYAYEDNSVNWLKCKKIADANNNFCAYVQMCHQTHKYENTDSARTCKLNKGNN